MKTLDKKNKHFNNKNSIYTRNSICLIDKVDVDRIKPAEKNQLNKHLIQFYYKNDFRQ